MLCSGIQGGIQWLDLQVEHYAVLQQVFWMGGNLKGGNGSWGGLGGKFAQSTARTLADILNIFYFSV